MTRKIPLITILTIILLTSCRTDNHIKVAPGVTSELAACRRQAVSDLAYRVEFDLPESPDAPVTGTMSAGFSYSPETSGDLALDFKAPQENLRDVRVNGQEIERIFDGEHIIIPASRLSEGKNEVTIGFQSGETGLNRREGYVYTLFVPDRAHGVFPCFDQPDMKASFSLSLTVPEKWKAVGNTYSVCETSAGEGRKKIDFAPTEPLSTYLFAFAAGEFEKVDYEKDGRKISAYHRETDRRKISQLDDIFADVVKSLEWQEKYTGMDYPFAKYDLVILPGFQFGGMEHTGATFYNDRSLFLGDTPTPDEYLRRSSLIAHETSHMWFGDLVTMRWFDDVWTKEVFANYFGANITRELLPGYDHDVEWLRNYTSAALSEDRSEGRTSIRQQLDNLSNAGLVYNNIIYNKAPVMMAKLVDLMGADAFREGIREYVRTFSYDNADWDELIDILSRHTDEDVKGFSRVWVYEKGMPEIICEITGDSLVVSQKDPLDRGNVWPQRFQVMVYDGKTSRNHDVVFRKNARAVFPLYGMKIHDVLIIPNFDGKGYGHFVTSSQNIDRLMQWMENHADRQVPLIARMAILNGLYENYLSGLIPAEKWASFCLSVVEEEKNPQLAATIVGWLDIAQRELVADDAAGIERRLWEMSVTHPLASCRISIIRSLTGNAVSPEICDSLYAVWEKGESALLSEKDFMNLAYQLSVRYPGRDKDIISRQRGRLSNPDRIAEFDYVSRGAVSDVAARDSVFKSLAVPVNRRIEPWTNSLLSLLFHPLREGESRKNLIPALEMLADVQAHGDIFYPANWSKSVLSQLRDAESCAIVDTFLSRPQPFKTNRSLSEENVGMLKNKVRNGAYHLTRIHRRVN